MKNTYLQLIFIISFQLISVVAFSQDIPQHISFTGIYDFMDELANEGVIEINSAIKPYSRNFIADKLVEAESKSKVLNIRQKKELNFYLVEFALELKKLPDSKLKLYKNGNFDLALLQPAFNYKDTLFRARITPILGMNITTNKNGNIIKRWYGADFQSMIGKNLSVYGSLRDISIDGQLLARRNYLNDYPGYEYKESPTGGDFSDSRGGIKYANRWMSFGLVKDNVVWGDNYHGSNILSGRSPSFPMLTFHLKPVKWFELNFLHGWLVSNIVDSSRYYVDNKDQKFYRMANKFIAANMFTFTPINKLNISVGNSIIYSERFIQPAYLLPVAFYKSIDHSLTKGLSLENQNSQVFLNVSSRNIRHLHLYTSIFADEIGISRFMPDSKERNPISYKLGAHLSNFPVQNLSLTGEFTQSGIITYKHSIPSLTWASNSYNLGHYLGDNSREIYLAMAYKPLRGLDLNLSLTTAKHGNEFNYIRRNSDKSDATKVFLSQPVLGEVSWSNTTFGFNARYEIINNAYAIVNVMSSDINGYDLTSTPIPGDESENLLTAQGYLDLYSPKFLQGKNTTISVGFSFGF